MARALMILGTHSNAGKSLLATAFCRIFARRGMRVAPFKAQNMSNNAGVTPEGGEMGRAQIVQAEAAGIYPHTDMNPVLLKPEGNRRSQVVLNGEMAGRIEAGNWMETKERLWSEVTAAYDRLAARYDVVVLEGAGSPAEINLKAGDIVNLRMAGHAGASCLLVGDIDRGGVFAALAGTMLLLEPEERLQIGGFLINRFRGDPALLGDGLEMLKERAFGVPTLGVIPYLPDLRIADEDAVPLERDRSAAALTEGQLDVAVIHLPRIANFDEFDALALEPGVRLRYVERAEDLGSPAAVILPGTKATLSDLAWLRERGLDRAVAAAHRRGAQVVGICGGYQMAGEWLADPLGMEGEPAEQAAGLGLLPVVTTFSAQKETHQAVMRLRDGETVRGYEIHTGDSRVREGTARFGEIIARGGRTVRIPDGAAAADGSAWGTYLHGLFENDGFRHSWLRGLGWSGALAATTALRNREYDRLADAVEEAVDWRAVEALMLN